MTGRRNREPLQAAIYAIRNVNTGAVYVGSTRNVKQRWMLHRSALRAGRHPAATLQAAWDQDGRRAFVLEVLEALPLPITADSLNRAEQMWFSRFHVAGEPMYSPFFHPRREKADSIGAEPYRCVSLRIPGDLYRQMVEGAARCGRSLHDYIVDLMRRGMAAERQAA